MTAPSKRNRTIWIAGLVAVLATVLAGEIRAYILTSIRPAENQTYRYYPSTDWRYFDYDHADPDNTKGIYRSRTYDARKKSWDDKSDSDWSIRYSSGSSNYVGWKYLTVAGSASTPCVGSDCSLHLNRSMWWDDEWYPGTGTTPAGQTDVWGVLVHEFGHWFGLRHSCYPIADKVPWYGPPPDGEMSSMCFDTGKQNAKHQRTVSQDELQGLARHFDAADIAINRSFERCCDGTNVPKYWMVTPDASKRRRCDGDTPAGECYMRLNNNSTVTKPELYQRAYSPDADKDDDGRFQLVAWVRAMDDTRDPKAELFIRHWHGSYSNHEVNCSSGSLKHDLGVWKQIACDVDMVNGSTANFEYGIRVNEKIDIDNVVFRDR